MWTLALVDELHRELQLPPLRPVGRPGAGHVDGLQEVLHLLGLLLAQLLQLGRGLLLGGALGGVGEGGHDDDGEIIPAR